MSTNWQQLSNQISVDLSHNPTVLFWFLTLAAKICHQETRQERLEEQLEILSQEVETLKEQVNIDERLRRIEERIPQ